MRLHSFFFISITYFWTEGPKIRDAYKKLGEKSGYTEGKSLSIMMLIKKMSVSSGALGIAFQDLSKWGYPCSSSLSWAEGLTAPINMDHSESNFFNNHNYQIIITSMLKSAKFSV